MSHLQKTSLSFVSVMFLLLGFAAFFPDNAQAMADVTRIYGDNRIETAIEISKFGWDSADTVILARADNPADALSSASLSSAVNAPILLTYTTYVPDGVLKEITRLGAKKVYLLGGTSAISQDVENRLARLSIVVKRIQGQTRFETAGKINIEAKSSLNDKAIIVNGFAVADALSASSHSARNHIPIYLATKTDIPIALPSNIKKVTIYGGEGVIGKEVENTLVRQGISVTRIAGSDRYKTNLQAVDPSLTENAILVRGTSTSPDSEQFPDAVAGAGLAYKLNANIILSHPTIVIPEVAELFKENRYAAVFVLGGENAVSTDTVAELISHPYTDVNKVFNYNIIASVMDPEKPVVYHLSDDDNSIKSYNYLTGEMKSIPLTERPEQLYVENNKIYITLVHRYHDATWWKEDQTGGIAIVDTESFQLIKKLEINLDPFDIVADKNGFIYVSSGSGQWTAIKSYSEVTGEEVSSWGIRHQSYIEMRPDQTKIYAINTDTIPRDIEEFTISNGKFTGSKDSPYHGDYDLGSYGYITDITVSPDGRYLFNNTGHVFKGNLEHVAELEVPFTDITFNLSGSRFYTGIANVIFQHQYDDLSIDKYFLTNGEVVQLYYKENKLYILSILTAEKTGLQNYALEVLTLPAVGQQSANNDSMLLKAIENAE